MAKRERARWMEPGVLIPLAILCASFSLALPAEADPLPPPADTSSPVAYLELVAPGGCAGRDELIERVRRRSPRVQFGPRERAERTIFAEIRPLEGRGLDASFTFIQGSGRPSRRHVQAKTCDEALDALALLVTLALDPDSYAQPQALPPPPEAPRTEVSAEPLSGPSVVSVPPPVPVSEAPSPLPAASESTLTVAAGAGGLASWGSSPEVMPGAFLYAGGSWPGQGLWSPALRLSATHVARDGLTGPGGMADFALDVLGLDACPLGLSATGLTLRACATGAIGQLSTRGSDARAPQAYHRPFAALGGSLLVTYEPGLRLELLATVGASLPLIRDSFQFGRPDVFFFQVRPLTVTAGLGLGFRVL